MGYLVPPILLFVPVAPLVAKLGLWASPLTGAGES